MADLLPAEDALRVHECGVDVGVSNDTYFYFNDLHALCTGANPAGVRFYKPSYVPAAMRRPVVPVPQQEPATDVPVARIKYNPEYKAVMEFARGVQKIAEHSPRALVLYAFALRMCPAHYSFWKARRDVLLSADAFAGCCHWVAACRPTAWLPPPIVPLSPSQQRLYTVDWAKAREAEVAALVAAATARGVVPGKFAFAAWLDGKLAALQPGMRTPTSATGGESSPGAAARRWEAVEEMPAWERLLVYFAPHGPSALLPHADGASVLAGQRVVSVAGLFDDGDAAAADGGDGEGAGRKPWAAPWRYDVWRAVAWELRSMRFASIATAKSFQTWNHRKELLMAAAAETAADARGGAPAGGDGRGDDVTFADFDERELCATVLRDVDTKNYHVWAHRAWFAAFTGITGTAAGVAQEHAYCDAMLDEDPWNNSAWAHRIAMTKLLVTRWARAAAARPTDAPVWALAAAAGDGVDPAGDDDNVFPTPLFPYARVPSPRAEDPKLLSPAQRHRLALAAIAEGGAGAGAAALPPLLEAEVAFAMPFMRAMSFRAPLLKSAIWRMKYCADKPDTSADSGCPMPDMR